MPTTGRAIMAAPRLMLLDEPSLGLAPLLVEEIYDIIRRFTSEHQTSVLLVEQNVQMALAVSDYAYVLSEGRVEIEGQAAQVRQMKRVRETYFGV